MDYAKQIGLVYLLNLFVDFVVMESQSDNHFPSYIFQNGDEILINQTPCVIVVINSGTDEIVEMFGKGLKNSPITIKIICK